MLILGCAPKPMTLSPNPSHLGCYQLTGSLPASYSDSLGYHVPDVFQLAESGGNQWVVFPTSFEWHPNWKALDDLPSGMARRARQGPPHVIPGDSIDVHFPGPIGALVLRLSETSGGLSGRSEWVGTGSPNEVGPSYPVEAPRASCADLATELERSR
jgi:hypothetical protein